MTVDSEHGVATGNGHGSEFPVAMRPVETSRRLDVLAPLIHQLITWDLVRRTESGTFVLQDDVQQRLQQMDAAHPQSTANVYVGRMCQRCGVVGVTRLVDDQLVCSSCSTAEADQTIAEPPQQTNPRRGRGWHRKAG